VFSIGGVLFYFYPIWSVITLTALMWFAVEYYLKGKHREKYLKLAFIVGIFIMIFDFIVENLGYVFGFWISLNSIWLILAVPIEVMIAFLLGGAAFALFMLDIEWDYKFIALNSIIFSFFGAIAEWALILMELMQYGNNWSSVHAFLLYFVTFLLIYKFYFGVKKKF